MALRPLISQCASLPSTWSTSPSPLGKKLWSLESLPFSFTNLASAELGAPPLTAVHFSSSFIGASPILATDTVITGEGNGNPLRYSCLENAIGSGACQATIHGVTKNQTRPSDWTHTHTHCDYNFGFSSILWNPGSKGLFCSSHF